MPPASPSTDAGAEQLAPGVWVNHDEPVWSSADEFLAAHAEEWEPSVEYDDPPPKRTYPFPEWHEDALCQGVDEEMYFGSPDATERPAISMTQIRQAKAICGDCPVMATCLRTALGLVGENREEYGVWAGTSGRTRKRIWYLVDEFGADLEDIAEDILAGNLTKYEHDFELLVPKSVLPFPGRFEDDEEDVAA